MSKTICICIPLKSLKCNSLIVRVYKAYINEVYNFVLPTKCCVAALICQQVCQLKGNYLPILINDFMWVWLIVCNDGDFVKPFYCHVSIHLLCNLFRYHIFMYAFKNSQQWVVFEMIQQSVSNKNNTKLLHIINNSQ